MNQDNHSNHNQPVCPNCGSKNVLYRVRTDDYLCRRCGEAFKRERAAASEKEAAI